MTRELDCRVTWAIGPRGETRAAAMRDGVGTSPGPLAGPHVRKGDGAVALGARRFGVASDNACYVAAARTGQVGWY